MTSEIRLEIIKSCLTLGISLLTIGLGWVVGQRLTMRWNVRQKQREFDLATGHEFHKLYGEFFAIWKLWNYSLTPERGCKVSRSELLVRACAAEGAVESLFIRLAASRPLRDEDVRTLGKFRQGYQRIRETIGDNRGLEWSSANHKEYLAFKRLATAVARLIVSEKPPNGATVQALAESLISITSNKWEKQWTDP